MHWLQGLVRVVACVTVLPCLLAFLHFGIVGDNLLRVEGYNEGIYRSQGRTLFIRVVTAKREDPVENPVWSPRVHPDTRNGVLERASTGEYCFRGTNVCSPMLEGIYGSSGRVQRIGSKLPLTERARKEWIPATMLLIALNTYIAYRYWQSGAHPDQVGKIWNKMVHEGEYWRALSGSLSHFEVWHWGCNMMSLYNLGVALEGQRFSSLDFLLYNMTLLSLVPLIWTGLVYVRQRLRPETRSLSVPTVGYSGVLFAWMVVASLDRPSSCPIPFLPNVCVSSFEIIPGVRFSWGPLIQLALFQLILPRVSLLGHLSGILAGLLLQWGLLPLRYVQPAVSVPALAATLLCYRGRPWQVSVLRNDIHVGIALVTLAMYSTWDIGISHPMTVSAVLVFLVWVCSQTSVDVTSSKRLFVVILLVVSVTDSIVVASWLTLWPRSIGWLLVLLRAVVWVATLGHECSRLDSCGGIFDVLLRDSIVTPARAYYNGIASSLGRSRVALPGTGTRLGESEVEVSPLV